MTKATIQSKEPRTEKVRRISTDTASIAIGSNGNEKNSIQTKEADSKTANKISK